MPLLRLDPDGSELAVALSRFRKSTAIDFAKYLADSSVLLGDFENLDDSKYLNNAKQCFKNNPGFLQNRAARIITNATYDNTDNARLLRQLNWLNVPQLIDFETASLMYKIENGLVPAHLKQMFVKSEDLHSYDTRSANSGNFHLPKRRLNIGPTAFSFYGASL